MRRIAATISVAALTALTATASADASGRVTPSKPVLDDTVTIRLSVKSALPKRRQYVVSISAGYDRATECTTWAERRFRTRSRKPVFRVSPRHELRVLGNGNSRWCQGKGLVTVQVVPRGRDPKKSDRAIYRKSIRFHALP